MPIQMMLARSIFVDSSAWIAVWVESDAHHGRADEFYRVGLRNYRWTVTTNLVLAEVYARVRSRVGYASAMHFLDTIHASPRIIEVYADARMEAGAEHILRQYSDQDFSYTDAVSFAVMREQGISEAFAFDRHFEAAGFLRLPSPASP